ncbi:hypothetical protein VTJ04DRAFT_5544 [Mycothermus thermophilus]|uniref:uncharacterized protein n=1 Tax=Humicola insolens TaxID=85995 RepID=UPI0037439629
MSDSFSQWLRSFLSCGGARQKRQGEKVGVQDDATAVTGHPVVTTDPSKEVDGDLEKLVPRQLRHFDTRDSPARSWFGRSSSSVRRLKISEPTNFRHIRSQSFQWPEEQQLLSKPPSPPRPARSRPRSFRPIELSIYQPNNRLSAILPHVENVVAEPPPVHLAEIREENDLGERVPSQMSFHLPRSHARRGSSASEGSPPKIPPKSRARAHTSPDTERIVERIASAILEKERLQAEIERVIERQSIFLNRPPTLYYDMQFEPMPAIPAVPAAAPSFAERLSAERPRTAPSRSRSPHEGPGVIQELPELRNTEEVQPGLFTTPSVIYAAQISSTSSLIPPSATGFDLPLAPPLPLVLRPPLRKKKSFSRVSNWLFQPDESSPSDPSCSTTSVTSSPRPVKQSDGFYQCLAPSEAPRRTSVDTSSSVYTWTTRESGEDEDAESKTVPTTTAWSPEQTPKHGSRHTTPLIGADRGGFDKEVMIGLVKSLSPMVKPATMPTAPEVVNLAAAEPTMHRPVSVGIAI